MILMRTAQILTVTALFASSLALVGCAKIKEMIPAGILGGDEAPVEEGSDKEEKSEEKAEEKSEEKSEEKPEEKAEEKAEEKPEEKAEAAPAGDPAVKSDIPKGIKSKAKVEKVQVLGHTSEGGKYKFAAKKANPALKDCHRSAQVDKPGAVGKIKFKISLSGKGEVESVDIEKNKTGSDDLAACAAEAFKALDWPRGKDGEERVLAIPIMFKK